MADDLSRILKRFDAIPKAVKDEVAKTNAKIVKDMADAMRAIAPVNTGKLKASIETHGPGETVEDRLHGGTTTISEVGAAVTYGNAEAFYARFQEHGTVSQPPHPVVGPVTRSFKKSNARRQKLAVSRGLKKTKTDD